MTHSAESNSISKDEPGDDVFHPSTLLNKPKLSRQAALDAIKKRRRREEAEKTNNSLNEKQQSASSNSENPVTFEEQKDATDYLVRLKKLNDIELSLKPTTPPASATVEACESTDSTASENINGMNNARTTNTRIKLNDAQAHRQLQQLKRLTKEQEDKEDFVRVKPKEQIPITSFWTHMEPYFRNLTEEDRDYLKQKTEDEKYYLLPPLGMHYSDRWAEEDQELGLAFMDSAATSLSIPRNGFHKNSTSSNDSSNNNNGHNSDNNHSNNEEIEVEFGTLTDRLIASLVKENILSSDEEYENDEDINDDLEDEDEEKDDDPAGDEPKDTSEYASVLTTEIIDKYQPLSILQMKVDPTAEIVDFEERLKRELRYAGLLTDDDIDWKAKEDDEICAELRKLSRSYKEQVKANEYRKKKLLEVVDCQLQFEQYRQVLDTLDNQVEQGYLKRFRPQKSKKRKGNGPKPTLSENTIYAMEKRKTWVDALGGIFCDKNMNMPQQSIYTDNNSDNALGFSTETRPPPSSTSNNL
ncbi:histone acetyltransferases subunit 3-domain-containing protein [Mycotypha africana]|uniref:histone acetyltransferases subunit 3-domain-containing protein n=1 Tax=Mycotypha africana TaxID=64632 RepID=UPI00230008E3|nr:histone acetyltransferases subunit 3-domain-containing protein [Mycotypha africana]KAI8975763.1 histone acetyltransferases subunit 3-domain-containing protein [Mycotypha africana]